MDEKEPYIILRESTVAGIREKATNVFTDEVYKQVIQHLKEAEFLQYGTRRKYLVHKILQRCYADDAEATSKIVKDWSGR